jgi:hypothetical protein
MELRKRRADDAPATRTASTGVAWPSALRPHLPAGDACGAIRFALGMGHRNQKARAP